MLGNYAHPSWLSARTFRLGPTEVTSGDTADGAVTMNGQASTTTAVPGSPYNFFVASYGFEGFAKTAAESTFQAPVEEAKPLLVATNK
eukprot:SAG22_NODE_865_length_6783_cov_23.880461_6_plen_88_part_00